MKININKFKNNYIIKRIIFDLPILIINLEIQDFKW
jgi:hypothetical protein